MRSLALYGYSTVSSYWILGLLGDLIAFAGLLLALWARTTLGRNWGMPMTLRANPELVTNGPYAYIRHPIYTALFLMILGAVLVQGPFWLVVLVIVFIYFYASARKEESDMTAQFPNRYPAYKKGTKMMIPFVF